MTIKKRTKQTGYPICLIISRYTYILIFMKLDNKSLRYIEKWLCLVPRNDFTFGITRNIIIHVLTNELKSMTKYREG